MGWRDFQEALPQEFMEFMESMEITGSFHAEHSQEFMESMESMTIATPLIPLIPLIPQNIISENGSVSALAAQKEPDLISAYCPSYHGHCSVKIGGNYPDQCAATNCEYKDLPQVPRKWGIYAMADYCPEPTSQTTQHAICPCCNGSDFWLSAVQENHSVCRKCHPPAPGSEKGAE